MPKIASSKIVVLFEDEIVLAAKALEPFANKGFEPTKEHWITALRACYAALYSPELASGKSPVTVVRSHDLK